MREVAEAAGVSTATVSRALSDPARVSESVRSRIEVAVAKLGYTVNSAARSLRRNDTGVVLVLVPDIGNPFFSKLLKGVEQRARELSYSVLIGDTGTDNIRLDVYMRQVAARRVDGMILLSGRVPEGVAETVPAVIVSERVAGAPMPMVGIDNAAAASLAVQHLRGLGHRRIAHIAGPEGNVLTEDRVRGYCAALGGGVTSLPRAVAHGDFSIESGRQAACALMQGRQRPTAMFAANDEMAMGAIIAMKALGADVPGEVSVMGFDDIEFAAAYDPPITTIRQPRFEMGQVAMSLLGDRLRGITLGAPPGDEGIVLPVELIVRRSTAHALVE
ncbi:MAG: LacI family DNA-binding transcriptional regulator [Acetobacteraceae bacterium]|nr:LacI family DNA-binding transcriptional regulator [Acetobacteraceae bacterium]